MEGESIPLIVEEERRDCSDEVNHSSLKCLSMLHSHSNFRQGGENGGRLKMGASKGGRAI